MKHKHHHETKVVDQKAIQSSENEESDWTTTETSSVSERLHKKSRKSLTQFSVLRSDTDGLRMKISAIRCQTNEPKPYDANKFADNNSLETLKLKNKKDLGQYSMSEQFHVGSTAPPSGPKGNCSVFIEGSDTRSDASNNGKIKKLKLKRKKATKHSEVDYQTAADFSTIQYAEDKQIRSDMKESCRSLASLKHTSILADDNTGLSSSDNDLPALVDAAIKCVESDSDSHSMSTQPKIQYTSTLLKDFMEKTQMLSACVVKAKQNATAPIAVAPNTSLPNGTDTPPKKKRGRPKKLHDPIVVNESADSGVISSTAQSTSPSPKICTERFQPQAKLERKRDPSPRKIDIVNLDKRVYAMNERVLYPPPRSKQRKKTPAPKPTIVAPISSSSNSGILPTTKTTKEEVLDPVWRKIDVNSKFRRPSVSGYKSDGPGGSNTICSKILSAKSGYTSDYVVRNNHFSGYKSDASGKSRCSMKTCYSRNSRAKSCDGKHRAKFRRKRRPTVNQSKSITNLNEQDILQLAGLSLGQTSEESSGSAVCKPKIMTEEAEVSNVYKKYGEINRYITTGEYFGRNRATKLPGTKNLDSNNESQDAYNFLGSISNKLYACSRKSSVTAADLPLHMSQSRKMKSRRSSVASFCSSSFYSGVSKSKRRRRRKSIKFGCSKMLVVDSKLLTEIEIITNSFPTMCRIHCDKPVGSFAKEKALFERVVTQKSLHQNKRNLKKRKLSENIDFVLSNGIGINPPTTGKRRHKKTCSSPDDHKLPLKKRHYLLTTGDKTEKAHVAYVTESLKSQKETVEPKATAHAQKTNARTVSSRAAITPKKRHLLQTSEGGSNSPSYSNDTKLSVIKNSTAETFPAEVVNNKKRNRLEGFVSKIANASGNPSSDVTFATAPAVAKNQPISLPISAESHYPPPGIFEPSVELEIQIPMTKLTETSIITKSEVESPLDLLELHSKTFSENSSNSKGERVVESLLNKTGGNLIFKRKRKKINRTGFPSVKRKKRKVSELSQTQESDKKLEAAGGSTAESGAICDRVPHAGETSDTFLERNRTPRLSVVSLERLQGTTKKQLKRDDTSMSRTRNNKLTIANKKDMAPARIAKLRSTKQLAKPLSKKKEATSCTKEPNLRVTVNPLLHITFPSCKIRLKRRFATPFMKNLSTGVSQKKDTWKNKNEQPKQLALARRAIGPPKKTDSETLDFLEQEPLPAAYCDVAIDSESSSSASVQSEDSKSTNRKLKWKKNYLVAGLLSEYYKVNNDNAKKKKISSVQSKENNIESFNGPLLPPPPYCEKFFRRTEADFQLPYDIWWAYTNDKLPTRVTVPSWNYRKIRTNVYRCADVRPTTANIDRPTCNCKPNLGCGDDCLNRMVYTECYPSSCPTREKCQNQKIQRHEVAPGVERFMTENKGWGVRTTLPIKKGTYILEYVGEVVTEKEFKERMATLYANDTHHYCLHLDGGLVIDGHRMGSDGRFVNHSCSPNCEMQKWSVNGLSRMALFAARNIDAGEEISYDYNFSLFNPSEGQECRCDTPQCRGVIGGKSQRIKPLLEPPKPVDACVAVNNGRRNGRQRKRQGSARKDVVPLQSRDIVTTQLLQNLSEKDKKLIKWQRMFLIRNFEKVRRIRSKGLPPETGKPEPASIAPLQRRPSTPSSLAVQISALRSPRNIQTRGLTQAVQDPELEKMAKMAVVFREICSTLESLRDNTDKPQIVKLYSNLVKRKGKPAKEQSNAVKRKTVEFSIIQSNIEKGFYKDPVEFDEDVENLLAAMRELNRENEDKLTIIQKLAELYTKKKDEVYDQLVELAADRKSLKNFRTNIAPKTTSGAVSKNFSNRSKQTNASSEDIIGCICGLFKDEGLMIQCARCMVWQHTECTKADVNADSYLCERCEPRLVDREIPLDDFTEDGHRYYLSLMRRDLQIRQGDTVYVLRDIPIKDEKGNICATKKHTYETIGEIDYSECDIFRVERLWKDGKGKRVIFGHHFLRPHETFHEPSRRFYPNEVVRVPLYEVVPIELVIGRCWVLDRTTFCKGRPADCYAEQHVFICELRVDRSARFFSKAKVNWPTCTKNYAFKKFEEKLKISKTYAPHEVDPSLLKSKKSKGDAADTSLTVTPKASSFVSPTKKIGIVNARKRKRKIIPPLKTRKQKRNYLEAVLAAIKKQKPKNTQLNDGVLDVSYLLSGRGARQRKSIAANVPT